MFDSTKSIRRYLPHTGMAATARVSVSSPKFSSPKADSIIPSVSSISMHLPAKIQIAVLLYAHLAPQPYASAYMHPAAYQRNAARAQIAFRDIDVGVLAAYRGVLAYDAVLGDYRMVDNRALFITERGNTMESRTCAPSSTTAPEKSTERLTFP